MTNGDRKRFAEVFNALAAAFSTEPTKPMLQGYWMGLDTLTIEEFESAARQAIQTLQFFPRVADLKRLFGGVAPEVSAAMAWEAVKKAIGTHGSYCSMDFGPLINATVRNLGGWSRLCQSDSDELSKWIRKDFERLYLTFFENGIYGDSGRHLAGQHENDPNGIFDVVQVLAPGQPASDALKILPGAETKRIVRGARSGEPVPVGQLLGTVIESIPKRKSK